MFYLIGNTPQYVLMGLISFVDFMFVKSSKIYIETKKKRIYTNNGPAGYLRAIHRTQRKEMPVDFRQIQNKQHVFRHLTCSDKKENKKKKRRRE